jgi:hypothetical protein
MHKWMYDLSSKWQRLCDTCFPNIKLLVVEKENLNIQSQNTIGICHYNQKSTIFKLSLKKVNSLILFC